MTPHNKIGMPEVSHHEEDAARDHALIVSWAQGTESALETLLRLYQTRIYSFLLRMLRNAHDAEDATQETFIRVARKLDRFDSKKGKFKSWIFQIAYREGLRMAQKRKRTPLVSEGVWLDADGEGSPPEAVDPSPLPGSGLLKQEQAAWVAEAVETLPDAEKQVVLLRTYSELRFREIAEIMGTPLNTTLGRMRNASTRLREWFGERRISE